jgi:hypothetical protein
VAEGQYPTVAMLSTDIFPFPMIFEDKVTPLGVFGKINPASL